MERNWCPGCDPVCLYGESVSLAGDYHQRSQEQLIQVGVVNAFAVGAQTDCGVVMAAAVIASLPPLLVFILLQRQSMSGFALTRDK
jgi:ABC-type glycerol-3-phosphate transport system permease component